MTRKESSVVFISTNLFVSWAFEAQFSALPEEVTRSLALSLSFSQLLSVSLQVLCQPTMSSTMALRGLPWSSTSWIQS